MVIVVPCTYKKVVDIDTLRIVAFVTYTKPIRNFTVYSLPCVSMHTYHFPFPFTDDAHHHIQNY